LAYITFLSTTFLFSLDNTVVADVQPAILESFGRIELLPWIGVGFALGTMMVLPFSKIYGVYNIKWTYLFNIFLFELGSALCGASQNMTMLIIARVISGVGGSGMVSSDSDANATVQLFCVLRLLNLEKYAGTMTYVAVTTSMKERAMYMSGNAVFWGIGSVLGPVVSEASFMEGI